MAIEIKDHELQIKFGKDGVGSAVLVDGANVAGVLRRVVFDAGVRSSVVALELAIDDATINASVDAVELAATVRITGTTATLLKSLAAGSQETPQ